MILHEQIISGFAFIPAERSFFNLFLGFVKTMRRYSIVPLVTFFILHAYFIIRATSFIGDLLIYRETVISVLNKLTGSITIAVPVLFAILGVISLTTVTLGMIVMSVRRQINDVHLQRPTPLSSVLFVLGTVHVDVLAPLSAYSAAHVGAVLIKTGNLAVVSITVVALVVMQATQALFCGTFTLFMLDPIPGNLSPVKPATTRPRAALAVTESVAVPLCSLCASFPALRTPALVFLAVAHCGFGLYTTVYIPMAAMMSTVATVAHVTAGGVALLALLVEPWSGLFSLGLCCIVAANLLAVNAASFLSRFRCASRGYNTLILPPLATSYDAEIAVRSARDPTFFTSHSCTAANAATLLTARAQKSRWAGSPFFIITTIQMLLLARPRDTAIATRLIDSMTRVPALADTRYQLYALTELIKSGVMQDSAKADARARRMSMLRSATGCIVELVELRVALLSALLAKDPAVDGLLATYIEASIDAQATLHRADTALFQDVTWLAFALYFYVALLPHSRQTQSVLTGVAPSHGSHPVDQIHNYRTVKRNESIVDPSATLFSRPGSLFTRVDRPSARLLQSPNAKAARLRRATRVPPTGDMPSVRDSLALMYPRRPDGRLHVAAWVVDPSAVPYIFERAAEEKPIHPPHSRSRPPAQPDMSRDDQPSPDPLAVRTKRPRRTRAEVESQRALDNIARALLTAVVGDRFPEVRRFVERQRNRLRRLRPGRVELCRLGAYALFLLSGAVLLLYCRHMPEAVMAESRTRLSAVVALEATVSAQQDAVTAMLFSDMVYSPEQWDAVAGLAAKSGGAVTDMLAWSKAVPAFHDLTVSLEFPNGTSLLVVERAIEQTQTMVDAGIDNATALLSVPGLACFSDHVLGVLPFAVLDAAGQICNGVAVNYVVAEMLAVGLLSIVLLTSLGAQCSCMGAFEAVDKRFDLLQLAIKNLPKPMVESALLGMDALSFIGRTLLDNMALEKPDARPPAILPPPPQFAGLGLDQIEHASSKSNTSTPSEVTPVAPDALIVTPRFASGLATHQTNASSTETLAGSRSALDLTTGEMKSDAGRKLFARRADVVLRHLTQHGPWAMDAFEPAMRFPHFAAQMLLHLFIAVSTLVVVWFFVTIPDRSVHAAAVRDVATDTARAQLGAVRLFEFAVSGNASLVADILRADGAATPPAGRLGPCDTDVLAAYYRARTRHRALLRAGLAVAADVAGLAPSPISTDTFAAASESLHHFARSGLYSTALLVERLQPGDTEGLAAVLTHPAVRDVVSDYGAATDALLAEVHAAADSVTWGYTIVAMFVALFVLLGLFLVTLMYYFLGTAIPHADWDYRRIHIALRYWVLAVLLGSSLFAFIAVHTILVFPRLAAAAYVDQQALDAIQVATTTLRATGLQALGAMTSAAGVLAPSVPAVATVGFDYIMARETPSGHMAGLHARVVGAPAEPYQELRFLLKDTMLTEVAELGFGDLIATLAEAVEFVDAMTNRVMALVLDDEATIGYAPLRANFTAARAADLAWADVPARFSGLITPFVSTATDLTLPIEARRTLAGAEVAEGALSAAAVTVEAFLADVFEALPDRSFSSTLVAMLLSTAAISTVTVVLSLAARSNAAYQRQHLLIAVPPLRSAGLVAAFLVVTGASVMGVLLGVWGGHLLMVHTTLDAIQSIHKAADTVVLMSTIRTVVAACASDSTQCPRLQGEYAAAVALLDELLTEFVDAGVPFFLRLRAASTDDVIAVLFDSDPESSFTIDAKLLLRQCEEEIATTNSTAVTSIWAGIRADFPTVVEDYVTAFESSIDRYLFVSNATFVWVRWFAVLVISTHVGVFLCYHRYRTTRIHHADRVLAPY
ncbi:hypothetical protein J8273_7955 [Carpediemonas membranifera]|uniref:Uncharacterized protein n=1 Tax=Carpediemonas membranifera TaxID=201153 RepID=A0A8J6AYV0_9EUKA|nr:hypothetical protein J8273_7955 [Carpediemonas membranifera]|eukprot:KAG9390604.1 hypothetical protein J8273_7955 [Carpediemonas membranifera]